MADRYTVHPRALVHLLDPARLPDLVHRDADRRARYDRHRHPTRALAALRVGALHRPHPRHAAQRALSALVAQPPLASLQERALLVRRHHAERRPPAAHRASARRRPDLTDLPRAARPVTLTHWGFKSPLSHSLADAGEDQAQGERES